MPGMVGQNQNYPVQSTEKTLEIIRKLHEETGIRVTDLADRLDMNKSTVHNHLQTLDIHGFVTDTPDGYELSLRFLEIGGKRRRDMPLFKKSRSDLDDLANQSGEVANLLVEQGGKGVYIYRTMGEQAIELPAFIGMHTELHATSLGKAILAFLPEDRVDQILDHYGLPSETKNTVTDRSDLMDELEQVRADGVAYDDEEKLMGLRCVAAPITTPDQEVLGAISISAPTNRMKRERFKEEIPDLVRGTANVIELKFSTS